MIIVVDTNVFISSALSPMGNPAKIVDCIENNMDLKLYYNFDILAEYERVLAYDKLKIVKEKKEQVIEFVQKFGKMAVPVPSDIPLPDESDRIFYDLAKEAGAYLITGNKKHYPDEEFILTPAEFLEKIDTDKGTS